MGVADAVRPTDKVSREIKKLSTPQRKSRASPERSIGTPQWKRRPSPARSGSAKKSKNDDKSAKGVSATSTLFRLTEGEDNMQSDKMKALDRKILPCKQVNERIKWPSGTFAIRSYVNVFDEKEKCMFAFYNGRYMKKMDDLEKKMFDLVKNEEFAACWFE